MKIILDNCSRLCQIAFVKTPKRTKKQLVRDLKKHSDIIAKERDALRAMQGEIEDIYEPMDEALQDIEATIAALSEQL